MPKRKVESSSTLVDMDGGDWRLESPELPESVLEKFHEVLDMVFSDFGGIYHDDPKALKSAETWLRWLIKKYPYFIDGYHHLAMLLEETERKDEARQLWERAVNIGLQCVIERFCGTGNNLKWGWLDNRPFLRAYHSLGLQYMKEGNLTRAIGIFDTMLKANPNDNQGIRSLLVECYFEVDRPTDVLRVCMLYPNDGMEELLYGKVLALLKLGKKDKAEKALARAVKSSSNIARELSKRTHKRPAGFDERFATWGSESEAFVYWERQGHVWKNTPSAIDFVREYLKKQHTKGNAT